MVPVLMMVELVILSVVSGIGILTSAFIVALNIRNWTKGRTLSTCDLILVALGISCIMYQCTLVSETFSHMMLLEGHDLRSTFRVLLQLTICIGGTRFWITACLCVFYCVKIVDFNNVLLTWLKQRISRVVPWLLLGSWVGCVVLSMPVCWFPNADVALNLTATFSANSTDPGDGMQWDFEYMVAVNILAFILPILLVITSVTLILTSLCRHTQRMKANAAGFSKPRLEVHFGAARVVGSLLLIYVPSFLLSCWIEFSSSDTFYTFHTFINNSSVATQSLILIVANAKLKQALLKLLFPWRKYRAHPM